MSVDSHNFIISKLERDKAYSTREIASLCDQPVSNVRQKLQRLYKTGVLLKLPANSITYWALNPKNFERK